MVKFSEKLWDTICGRIAEGESLRSICADDNMPGKTTVMRWLAEDEVGTLRDQYVRARECQADTLFEEILEIADDARNDWMERNHGEDDRGWVVNGENVQRSRLRVDARRWMAGKLRPKVYGDKLDLNQTGEIKVIIAARDADL